MSVNVCVFKYDATSIEGARYNNQNTTPPFAWTPAHNEYQVRINERQYRCIPTDATNTGSTKTYGLPKSVETIVATSYNGTFRLETGYEVVASKNLTALECETVTTSDEDGTVPKSIFLSGEPCYFFAYSGSIGGKYRFLGWYSGETLLSQDNPFLRTIVAELSLTAFFEQYKWTLTTAGSGNGTAYIGASPSTTTSAIYTPGSTVSIRATVTTEGYKFSKWTVGGSDYSTSATISVTTGSADVTYTAVFIPINYTLNVTPENSEQGAVSVDGQIPGVTTGITVASLSGVTVRATPAFGHSFLGWYVGGSAISGATAVYSFTMPESNYSIEARFQVLATASLTVTKTKGNPADDAAAKDMGSVSLYHLESVLDQTSAAGTATLVASLYNTAQYKLVPSAASVQYQFDGWYKTVDATEVLIETGGIYVVDGVNLYITPVSTAAIPINAQFRKSSLRTISAVASDSSTYVEDNDAEDAGCTCTITSPDPDYTEGGDQWLSGQTISVEAVQAVGWELRQWLVKNAAGDVLTSKSKGAAGFGQTYTFNLTVNCQVIARSVYTLPADQVRIQALHKTGQDEASGLLEIHPCGDNYIELTNGVTANVDVNSVCELTAIPANGYKFVNWRIAAIDGTIVSTVPVYSFEVSASAVYYAEFAATVESSLLLFEGSASTMIASWRGRINIANVPINFSCARVYADGYPVAIDIGAAESPSSPLTALRVVRSITSDQDAIRLPSGRKEKYSMIGFETNATVNAISVATSMEGLKNG